MKTTYEPVTDGDWMHLPRRGMYLACCDCHLVHDLAVRVDAKKQIWIKVTRHNRSTGALRRTLKFTKDDE
jgi:hypothetical protein